MPHDWGDGFSIIGRCDSSLFIYRQGSQVAYLLIYMDDIILTASCLALLQQIIGSLNNEFDMTDLGGLNYFLGISADRTHTESKLGTKGAPVQNPTLYRSLARELQYLTFTHLDFSYAVPQICLYMHDPREPHLAALKRILLYVQGTLDLGLHLYASSTTSLIRIGYSRANDNWTLRYLGLVVPLTKVGDEAIHKELGDKMERATTTTSSLEAEQDSGGYTPGCDEGKKKLNELMKLCTKLSKKVTTLEQDLKQSKQVYGKALTKLMKKGRMSKTKYEDVETEHAEEESSKVHLDVVKRLSKATPEEEIKMMYYGSYKDISIVNCSYGIDARQKVASRRR
ncbi:ribonuclease H-like domain-containing protein [Tanacetum coccineum]